MYECELCKTKLNVSLIEFKENLILKEQIEKSLFLKPNMRTLKSSLDAKLDEIEDHLRKMNEASEGELLLKICDYNWVRSQVKNFRFLWFQVYKLGDITVFLHLHYSNRSGYYDGSPY